MSAGHWILRALLASAILVHPGNATRNTVTGLA